MTTYRSALVGCASVILMAGAAQAQALVDFSVPAGPLGAALNAYARQADRQLMFTSDQVAGRRTRGVVGRMSADEALSRLLEGSGLSPVQSASGV